MAYRVSLPPSREDPVESFAAIAVLSILIVGLLVTVYILVLLESGPIF